MSYARLDDRALMSVAGSDAMHFLQNLITADIEGLNEGEMRPSALLTPQGKILFDFLIGREGGAYLIDVAKAAVDDLLKRLTLYKLRSKVELGMRDETIFALWSIDGAPESARIDRRFPDGDVFRLYADAPPDGIAEAEPGAFEALRIAAGVAEAETDYPGSDIFPHDVLLDQNGGVSFKKGCFVGQEVVSRMQHRGTARRRLVLVESPGHFTRGAEITADGKALGTVLAASGASGMAIVRIDRLARALGVDATVAIDGSPATVRIPSWAGYRLPETAEDTAADSEA